VQSARIDDRANSTEAEHDIAGVDCKSALSDISIRRFYDGSAHMQTIQDGARVNAASVPAPTGGNHTSRKPTHSGKLSCKHYMLVDQRGLP
jgi:hypothetical protein